MVNNIGIIFILLVIMYMVLFRRNLVPFDIILLVLSLGILVLTILKGKGSIELFSEKDGPKDISKFQAINSQENYSVIIPKSTIYLTTFNTASYPGSGNEWINVAYKEPAEACNKVNNKKFMFENTPIFSKKNGLMLGTNRLFGPYSNNLNISLQSTFTIYFACRHGEFIPNTNEVELFKLYANSKDNNGMAFFIKANSIVTGNNVQSGNLMFKFVDDNNATECKLNSSDTSLTFDKINMSMYFIVKDVDKIRILYMLGGSSTINKLATINISETNSTFSNKELVINRFQNWKGCLFQFGIIPEAVSDNTVSSLYNHVYGEYLKVTNEDYINLTNDFNALLDYLKNFTACPYDETVCATCSSITKWTDINQIVSAPTECKDAINNFCKINTKNPLCKCWDTMYSGYQTDSCRMYRSIFSKEGNLLDNISQGDLSYIKEKYNLMKDCPKVVPSCTSDEMKKNTYIEYDFDKLKIKPRSLVMTDDDIGEHPTSSKKIASPYKAEPSSLVPGKPNQAKEPKESDKKKEEEPKNVYKPVKLNGKSSTPNKDKMHAYRVPGEEGEHIKNIYQTDANIKFDEKNNAAFNELENAQKSKPSPFMTTLMNYFLP